MAEDDQWAFLEPWRRLLRLLVRFEDHEELLVGTLHEQLRCIRVDLFQYVDFCEPGNEEFDLGCGSDVDEQPWRNAFLTKLREALELIGLALHYDKRVWRWLRPKYGLPTFHYDDTSTLEPLFQFAFHDTWWSQSGDHQDEVDDGFAVILRKETTGLSDDYFAAKMMLRELVGARYDPAYRVQVSLVLAPRVMMEGANTGWCASIRKFVWAARSHTFVASSCFKLVAITLYGWRLRLDESLASLLSDLLLAQVQIPELSLKLLNTRGIFMGRTFNQVCERGAAAGRLVDDIGIHECALQPFIHACTSLMEARSPRRLVLYEAFGQDPMERAIKWAWIGYALSGGHVAPTSIQHLRIEDSCLSASDLRNLATSIHDSRNQEMLPPPPTAYQRRVRLSPDACIFVGGEYWHTLGGLGLTDDQSFEAIEDAMHGERMQVVVPGFGVCEVNCDAVVDAIELPASSTAKFALSSLQCGINDFEPEALQILSSTFGSTLTRLKLCLGMEMILTHGEAYAFLSAFPLLEFLDLNHVSLGSMDVLLAAYESGKCSVAVLSMINSYVEPVSMTRFARQLRDPAMRITQCLREFRFIFEDYHPSADGACPAIITARGATAFRNALHGNRVLTFVDIGLTQTVYDQFFDALTAYDKVQVAKQSKRSKLAFLSVLQAGSSSPVMKKPRHEGVRMPVRRRRRIVPHIWGYLEPRVRRVVSVICVPRE